MESVTPPVQTEHGGLQAPIHVEKKAVVQSYKQITAILQQFQVDPGELVEPVQLDTQDFAKLFVPMEHGQIYRTTV